MHPVTKSGINIIQWINFFNGMNTMLNHTVQEKLPVHFLKASLNKPFNDKTLTVKRLCYQCHGAEFYHYCDPLLEMQGYYEHDFAEPERLSCFHCDGGYVILTFSSLKELTNWVEKKIQHQDWTYDYSDDPDVRRREYFYQSLVQEFLWLLPDDLIQPILNKYQNNGDKYSITVPFYQTKAPTNYHLHSEYYFSHSH